VSGCYGLSKLVEGLLIRCQKCKIILVRTVCVNVRLEMTLPIAGEFRSFYIPVFHVVAVLQNLQLTID